MSDRGQRQRTGQEDEPKKEDSGQELRPCFPCLKSSGCRSLPLLCLVVCRVCDSHHSSGKQSCLLSLASCQTWGFISPNSIATANKGNRPCPLPQQDKQWLSQSGCPPSRSQTGWVRAWLRTRDAGVEENRGLRARDNQACS